ncbi:hypothetical protein CHS0354_035222 [Potamilus streckersoni]|uniref:(R)-citramalate synthase n=1 Tax=Potamilus streckersoni TaxID=2493646 RepID=A0AAE0S2L1_9BIVA|nr:hypothetical protein CHS0354_035222 [Potamilus streckersoni]
MEFLSDRSVLIFDTTLRDGGQSEDVSFSVEDKIEITRQLSDFGMHYIEGGWPGSNPKDEEYFAKIRHEVPRLRAKLTCFGSTRKKGVQCDGDDNIQKLVRSGVPVACIFGKTWDFHVTEGLGTTPAENLDMIADSVALKTLQAAHQAGADFIVLCDTNGGTMPWEVEEMMRKISPHISAKLGIHTHNDSETGVANALTAIRLGAEMVQGTVNGFGERCGNCNLISVIANLQFKMGIGSIPPEKISGLRHISAYIREKANMHENKNQPYTGQSAFAHKGGIHASAVMKFPAMYEHIDPERVGNERRVLVSDMSGISNIKFKLDELDLGFTLSQTELTSVRESVKAKEKAGFVYESADASLHLEILRTVGKLPLYYTLAGYRIIDEKNDLRGDASESISEATIRIISPQNELIHTVAGGDGPVDALSNALKRALVGIYEVVSTVRLTDYKVRILNSDKGTAAMTRVLIQFEAGDLKWETVGVHYDIIRASYMALADAMNYLIYKTSAL